MTTPGPCAIWAHPVSPCAGLGAVSSKGFEDLGSEDPPYGQAWDPGKDRWVSRARPTALSIGKVCLRGLPSHPGCCFNLSAALMPGIVFIGICSTSFLPLSVRMTVPSLPCSPDLGHPPPPFLPSLPSPISTALYPCVKLPCPKAS